jgi:hypothetical protein
MLAVPGAASAAAPCPAPPSSEHTFRKDNRGSLVRLKRPAVRARYARSMTVRDLLTQLQYLPRDAEVLAMEAGCEEYCERELDLVELEGGRVYLHLGVRRDEPPRS